MSMIKRMAGALVLLLLVSLSGAVDAAENKMTREGYRALLAEYTQREDAARQDIEGLNGDIAQLRSQLAALDADIANLNQQILGLMGVTDPVVRAFGRQLDAIIRQLEGLMALPPEQLFNRRGEVKLIEEQVAELRASRVAALPEMKVKLQRIDRMLAELKARIAQPITVDYKVVRGDNLWSIAKQDAIYADPYMWPRIYRANRDQIRDPDLIYPNQTLAVPFGVRENEYLVTGGDFLFRIAAEVYNDPSKWTKIFEANKQQIVEPHLIFPAQVLEIPSN